METTSPAFRHTLPLQLRFNDIDLLGHVNNSVYFSFYDLGKARYFETVKAQNIDWKPMSLSPTSMPISYRPSTRVNPSPCKPVRSK